MKKNDILQRGPNRFRKKINSTGYWIYCMNKTELYRLLREKRGMSHLTLTSERLNR